MCRIISFAKFSRPRAHAYVLTLNNPFHKYQRNELVCTGVLSFPYYFQGVVFTVGILPLGHQNFVPKKEVRMNVTLRYQWWFEFICWSGWFECWSTWLVGKTELLLGMGLGPAWFWVVWWSLGGGGGRGWRERLAYDSSFHSSRPSLPLKENVNINMILGMWRCGFHLDRNIINAYMQWYFFIFTISFNNLLLSPCNIAPTRTINRPNLFRSKSNFVFDLSTVNVSVLDSLPNFMFSFYYTDLLWLWSCKHWQPTTRFEYLPLKYRLAWYMYREMTYMKEKMYCVLYSVDFRVFQTSL